MFEPVNVAENLVERVHGLAGDAASLVELAQELQIFGVVGLVDDSLELHGHWPVANGGACLPQGIGPVAALGDVLLMLDQPERALGDAAAKGFDSGGDGSSGSMANPTSCKRAARRNSSS